jgi:hypothetical protein
MNQKAGLLIGVLLIAAVVIGLFWPDSRYLAVDEPITLTLYSLDGKTYPQLDSEEAFHNFPVLGKVNVKNVKTKTEIVAAINAGVAEGDSMAKCFWPRHGVSLSDGEKTLDFVICFECFQVKRFDGESVSTTVTSAKREPFFDKLLTDAGVEIAPK